jgi:hypothetical protein
MRTESLIVMTGQRKLLDQLMEFVARSIDRTIRGQKTTKGNAAWPSRRM